MSWNYRLVRVQDRIGVFEVYYDECNAPEMRTKEPTQIWCTIEGEDELNYREVLGQIQEAFLKPVLDDSVFNHKE